MPPSSPTEPPVVIVGIDLGRSHARVCCNNEIISNPQGQRFTPTYCCCASDNQEEAAQKKKFYIVGDAALKHLQQHKLELRTIRDQLESEEAVEFVRYLLQMAADASAVAPQQLRMVWSVPSSIVDEERTTYIQTLKETATKAIYGMIENDNNNNKSAQKKVEFCIGFVKEATAVGLLGLIGSSSNNRKGSTTPTTISSSRSLIVDGGASGTKLTILEQRNGMLLSSPSSEASIVLNDISGPALMKTLAQFAAQQFERQCKLPRGEVWENSKKARMKLEREAARAITAFSSSDGGGSSMRLTIDGLYEGMDCHVVVSKPRWEMMTSKLKRRVETVLKEQILAKQPLDRVLVAGALASWLQPIISGVFGADIVVSKLPNGVAPEEAIAMGCALHGQALTEQLSPAEQEYVVVSSSSTATSMTATLSPLSIGLGSSADSVNCLIPTGMPLPAHVLTMLPTTTAEAETMMLWQSSASIQASDDWSSLAKLEPTKSATNGNPISDADREVILELTPEGQLLVSVGGGDVVAIGA